MPTHCIWLLCLPALAELSVQVIPSQDLISDEPSQHTSQAGPSSLFHQLESGARTLRRLVSTCRTSQGKGCLDEDPDFKVILILCCSLSSSSLSKSDACLFYMSATFISVLGISLPPGQVDADKSPVGQVWVKSCLLKADLDKNRMSGCVLKWFLLPSPCQLHMEMCFRYSPVEPG